MARQRLAAPLFPRETMTLTDAYAEDTSSAEKVEVLKVSVTALRGGSLPPRMVWRDAALEVDL